MQQHELLSNTAKIVSKGNSLKKMCQRAALTFGAVVVVEGLLPTRQALLDTLAVALVVAILVVTRPAEGVAVLAVVVGRADHPVLKVQALAAQVLDVLAPDPVGSGLQALQLGYP